MDTLANQNQSSNQPPQSDTPKETAVRYTPQEPQIPNKQKYFRSPLLNGLIIVGVVLLVGFMAYNFVGHQLTKLASDSTEKVVSPTPKVSPSPTIYQTP